MSDPLHSPTELQAIYQNRFDQRLVYRNRVWQILVSKFFSKLIRPDTRVLDLGCGYGEFINNISCSEKFAMDMNPSAAHRLSNDVTFIEQDCTSEWRVPADYFDVVFTSNFFEHLPSKTALSATISQVRRCLRQGGIIIAMGPNVRFVGGAYWDFWDHHIPLTDAALVEVLSLNGFVVVSSIPRFLPYTMVNQRATPTMLVSIYLKLPLLWRFMGKQFVVVGRKVA
jgi:SAM-dependent methyltransferase